MMLGSRRPWCNSVVRIANAASPIAQAIVEIQKTAPASPPSTASGFIPLLLVPGCEDAGAVVGDGDRELEMRGEGAVRGVNGPVVVAQAHVRAARIDHGLDREDHPRLELGSPPGVAVVRDLRVLVHVAAYPMAHQRADDREPLPLD